ncbi:MAG: NIPSNAP family protein [Rhodospirillales bacterium]|nr:NIPSNAP family protein [Rhodospirillales bacterium]MDE2575750.1 NIPSNAP family protein [Rhodospirillales bacterium]
MSGLAMAAAGGLPGKPLVDIRTYTIRPRAMAEFLEVFDRLAMPVLTRAIGTPLGFYTSLIGPLNQFTHLWAYEGLADYEARGALRDADPQWPTYLGASGHLIIAQENRLVRAAAMPSLTAGAP